MVHQDWKLTVDGEETTLSQAAFPFSLYLPVADNWEIRVASALSRSSLEATGTSTSLTSFSGSNIRVFHSLAQDQVFVSGGVVLPLGKTELDTLEVQLAELISDDYLSTTVKQVSEGFGFVTQLGAATEANGWLLFGGSVSYSFNGSFTYFQDGEKYNPGDEVAIQTSATATNGDASLDMDLSYRHYFADKVEDSEVFKSGGVIAAVISGRYKFNEVTTVLTLAHIARNKNSILFGSSLETEDQNSNSNKSVVSGSVSYAISDQVGIQILGGYRTLSANDYETSSTNFFGKSDVFSIGGGLQFTSIDGRYTIFGMATLSSGEANKDAGESRVIDVSGTEIVVGGKVAF